MDGGIGELARLAGRFQDDELLLRLQQSFAGVQLCQWLDEGSQNRPLQQMMASARLDLEGIAQEELQPVQPDLTLLCQLGADTRHPGRRL